MQTAEPVAWLKYKYRCPKQKGGHKSGHNDNNKRTKNKTGKPDKVPAQRVMVVGPSGKICFMWRPW